MDNSSLYVTKRELYTVASNICVLILFTVLLEDRGSWGRTYLVIWALILQMYCSYKLMKTKARE